VSEANDLQQPQGLTIAQPPSAFIVSQAVAPPAVKRLPRTATRAIDGNLDLGRIEDMFDPRRRRGSWATT